MDDHDHDRSSGSGIVLIIVVAVLLLFGAGGGGLYLVTQAQRSRMLAARSEAEAMQARAEADALRIREEAVRNEAAAKVAADQREGGLDPLDDLNQSFRAAYKTLRLETIAHSSPVVVVDGDNLILFRNGKRTSVTAVPRLFNILKTYAHIPLAAYLVTRSSHRQADPVEFEEFQKYALRVNAEKSKRSDEDLDDVYRKRHDVIIDATAKYLSQIMFSSIRLDPKDRLAFAREMAPLVLSNAADAAKAQIDGYDKQMTKWRTELSADEWKRLKILVMGSQMPRQGNIAVQYFAWLLNEPGEGKRIIYSEGVFDEQKALGLMATHEIDTDIGIAFFNEERRMHRDLLADAAKEILKKMKP